MQQGQILISAVFIPIILAFISAKLIRTKISKLAKDTNQSNEYIEQECEKFQSYIDTILIDVFLVVVISFAILSSGLTFGEGLLLLCSGILFSILVYVFSYVQQNLSHRSTAKPEQFWLPAMPATFGGGNRGTLFILIVTSIPFITENLRIGRDDALKYFATIDLGIFFILVLKGRNAIKQLAVKTFQLNEPSDKENDTKFQISELLEYISPMAIFAVALLTMVYNTGALDIVDKYIKNEHCKSELIFIRSMGSYVFMYLAFLSMFIMYFRPKKEKTSEDFEIMYNSIKNGLFWRIIGSIFSMGFILLIQQMNNSFGKVNLLALLFCFIIFCILPPSSIFATFVKEEIRSLKDKYSDNEAVKNLNDTLLYFLTIRINTIFLFLLLIFSVIYLLNITS